MSMGFEKTTRIESATPAASVTLDGFAEAVATAGGLEVRGLAKVDTLEIWTRNSRYRVTVMDPQRCRVLIEGGAFFPDPTSANVDGASAGWGVLKLGWIAIGLAMEIRAGGRRVVTSPVRPITSERSAVAGVH